MLWIRKGHPNSEPEEATMTANQGAGPRVPQPDTGYLQFRRRHSDDCEAE